MPKPHEKIENIQSRNARVEAEKAWETSKTRRACIAVFTYIVASLYLAFLGVPQFYLHAAVPTAGFLLSTLTLPFIKKWWMKRFYISEAGNP